MFTVCFILSTEMWLDRCFKVFQWILEFKLRVSSHSFFAGHNLCLLLHLKLHLVCLICFLLSLLDCLLVFLPWLNTIIITLAITFQKTCLNKLMEILTKLGYLLLFLLHHDHLLFHCLHFCQFMFNLNLLLCLLLFLFLDESPWSTSRRTSFHQIVGGSLYH